MNYSWNPSTPQLQLHLLSDVDTLGKVPDPRVDRATLLLQPLTLLPELRQRHRKHLDELALLQLRLGVLVLRQAHVDGDVHHLQVRRAETRVVPHDGAGLARDAHVARLLPELAHGGLLRRLPGVDETRGDLDGDGVQRGAVLLLEDDGGSLRQVEDGQDADAVDLGGGRACRALRVLPRSLYAIGILVCCPAAGQYGRAGEKGRLMVSRR